MREVKENTHGKYKTTVTYVTYTREATLQVFASNNENDKQF